MKQKISIRAIIQENGKTLLLRRSTGRATILGKYELPGGKIGYGEQPEDALRRYIRADTGLDVKTLQLFDAVTYIDYDDSSVQYIVIVYIASIIESSHRITLSGNYDKYVWQSKQKLQQHTVTDLTQLLLGIIQHGESNLSITGEESRYDAKDTTAVTIFTDGGSRGNPGPSAAGFVIIDSGDTIIAQGGEHLGITTNNQAEYHGVRLGLENALALGYTAATVKVDSMLVVNQLKGIYRIKNRELWPIHDRIREIAKKFHRLDFIHINREFNQLADGMVNKTLDVGARAEE